MDLTRDQREELKALSKEVFGNESKWKKLLERGYYHEETEEKEETVPGETKEDGTVVEATTRKVKVPILNKHGQRVKTVKYHTYESLLKLMVDFKKQMDEIKAQMKKQQDEQQAIQTAQRTAGGSAAL